MGLASSLQKVADKVIAKLGGEVIVRYVSAGAYNATTGVIGETTSDTETRGAPETKDRVVISSVVHQIISVETIEQDNEAITYELILRA